MFGDLEVHRKSVMAHRESVALCNNNQVKQSDFFKKLEKIEKIFKKKQKNLRKAYVKLM